VVQAKQMGRTGSMPEESGHLAGQGVVELKPAEEKARCCCKEMGQGVRTCSEDQQVQVQVVPGWRGDQQRKEAAREGCERESSWLEMVVLGQP